jgi:hypothetical protein
MWNDVRWPGRPIANIDGVVLGPFGLLVWDAKHWSGRITLHVGVLRHNGYRRDDKVNAVHEAVEAVLQAAHLPPIGIPLLCLTSTATVTHPTTTGRVHVVSVQQLPAWLAGRPTILSPAAVTGMAQALARVLIPAAPPTVAPRQSTHWSPALPPRAPAHDAPARRPPARRPSGQRVQPGQATTRRRRPANRDATAPQLIAVAVLLIAAMTGVLGRVLTPAASWIGHQESKQIIKQSTPTQAPTRP